ncbi:MAG TPA: 50S ribosomal protein L25 [Vicinamibacterales bacterium]|jgi:large subunit ribosomal protein L25|nr:50S ribosomal protein L25 [Vicinamibacterales bacterium]
MDATLEAKKRDGRGKNEARRLRVSGQIPAVVYGARKEGQLPEGVPVAVDPKEVLRILHSESGANTLINLKLDGGESRVMVRDYQLDPITHQLLHADFYQLAMDKAITVSVPILVKGEPVGVKKEGGLLDFVTREIQVQCLPTDIPEHIDIDVSELALHQSIRVKDIATNPKWKAMTDGETMLVHVVMPKAEESAATAATEEGAAAAPVAAAPAEPEVIKKGKTEEKEEKK